jgi:hypothetical protein
MFRPFTFTIHFLVVFHFLPWVNSISGFIGISLRVLWFWIRGIRSLKSIKGGKQELLLKNITQILDLLLEDYDSSQHPNYRYGN